MVFWRTSEVFQTNLIFNGDQQHTAGFKQLASASEPVSCRVGPIREAFGVFKNPDQCYGIEPGFGRKSLKVINNQMNIGKVLTALFRYSRTTRSRF